MPDIWHDTSQTDGHHRFGAGGEPATGHQHDFIGTVGDGMHGFGQHGGRSGEERRAEFRNGDADVRTQCRLDGRTLMLGFPHLPRPAHVDTVICGVVRLAHCLSIPYDAVGCQSHSIMSTGHAVAFPSNINRDGLSASPLPSLRCIRPCRSSRSRLDGNYHVRRNAPDRHARLHG